MIKFINGNKFVFKKLLIAISGPMTNILICIIIFFINMDISLKSEIIYINTIIALFNLLPIYPLDGSQIINNTFKLFFDNKKSYKNTNIISNVILILFTFFCSIFILYAKNAIIVVILIYLWFIQIQENKNQKIRDKIYEKINV